MSATAEFATQTGQNHAWKSDAHCATLWGYFDHVETRENARTPRVMAAAAVCHTCPVQRQCHTDAQQPTHYGTDGVGIRAGLLYGRKSTPTIIPVNNPAATCGTLAGYANHTARHETACTACHTYGAALTQPVIRLPYPREPAAHGTTPKVLEHQQAGEELCDRCQHFTDTRLVSARPNNLAKYHARQERLRVELQGVSEQSDDFDVIDAVDDFQKEAA